MIAIALAFLSGILVGLVFGHAAGKPGTISEPQLALPSSDYRFGPGACPCVPPEGGWGDGSDKTLEHCQSFVPSEWPFQMQNADAVAIRTKKIIEAESRRNRGH